MVTASTMQAMHSTIFTSVGMSKDECPKTALTMLSLWNKRRTKIFVK